MLAVRADRLRRERRADDRARQLVPVIVRSAAVVDVFLQLVVVAVGVAHHAVVDDEFVAVLVDLADLLHRAADRFDVVDLRAVRLRIAAAAFGKRIDGEIEMAVGVIGFSGDRAEAERDFQDVARGRRIAQTIGIQHALVLAVDVDGDDVAGRRGRFGERGFLADAHHQALVVDPGDVDRQIVLVHVEPADEFQVRQMQHGELVFVVAVVGVVHRQRDVFAVRRNARLAERRIFREIDFRHHRHARQRGGFAARRRARTTSRPTTLRSTNRMTYIHCFVPLFAKESALCRSRYCRTIQRMTQEISYPALYLKRGEDARLRAGHLWVFSNEVDVKRSPLTGFEPGELCVIVDSADKPVGVGYANPNSLIAARLVNRGVAHALDRSLIVHKCNVALSLRERLYRGTVLSARVRRSRRLAGTHRRSLRRRARRADHDGRHGALERRYRRSAASKW